MCVTVRELAFWDCELDFSRTQYLQTVDHDSNREITEVLLNAIIRSVFISFIGREWILMMIMPSCSCMKILIFVVSPIPYTFHLRFLLTRCICQFICYIHCLSCIYIYKTIIFSISLQFHSMCIDGLCILPSDSLIYI